MNRLTTIFDNASSGRGLTRTEQAEAVGLLKRTPIFEAALAVERAEIDEERKAHIAALANLPKKFEDAQKAAGRACEVSAAQVERAEADLRAAQDKLIADRWAGEALRLLEQEESTTAERSLRESADPRLAEFVEACDELDQTLRHCVAWNIVPHRNWLDSSRWTQVVTNAPEIEAERDKVKLAATAARDLQLQISTAQEVTDFLNEKLHGLDKFLAPRRLGIFSLDPFGNIERDTTRPRRQIQDDAIRLGGGTVEPEERTTFDDPAPRRGRMKATQTLSVND